jgi:hypothetical protein
MSRDRHDLIIVAVDDERRSQRLRSEMVRLTGAAMIEPSYHPGHRSAARARSAKSVACRSIELRGQ